MTNEEYWYWLFNINGMWNGKMRKLLNTVGSPKDIFCASEELLTKVSGLKKEDISNIILSRTKLDCINELNSLKDKNIKFIYWNHKDYPEKLVNLYEPPYALMIKGNLPESNIPSVAIIGTRTCTNYGYEIAKSISSQLAANGVQIISGLAKGIDASAHKGAIDINGSTFAVLGCGIDICYPRENIDIFTECTTKGGIISEYPLGIKPSPWQFPRRNRIISALADIIIVVEAREKSGSLITVEHALEQGKDVYAVPGRINDPLSVGCNRLIKAGADVFISCDEIMEQLGIGSNINCRIYEKNKNTLEKGLQVVYSCLDLLPKSLDTIVEETEYTTSEVLQSVVRLQMMNLVCEPVKNYYAKKL